MQKVDTQDSEQESKSKWIFKQVMKNINLQKQISKERFVMNKNMKELMCEASLSPYSDSLHLVHDCFIVAF